MFSRLRQNTWRVWSVRMPSPPWHLILPPYFLEIPVFSLVLYLTFGLLIFEHCSFHHMSYPTLLELSFFLWWWCHCLYDAWPSLWVSVFKSSKLPEKFNGTNIFLRICGEMRFKSSKLVQFLCTVNINFLQRTEL